MQSILKKVNSWVEPLVPTKYIDSPILHRKARILTNIHLFSLVGGITIYFFSKIVDPSNPIPIIPCLTILVLLLFIFKKYGNLFISGNLLSALVALTIAPYVPETGGVQSDNLFWLILVPILSTLFTNKASGFFWVTALIIYTFLLHYFDASLTKVNSVENKADYYLISTTLLFIFIFGMVVIFETGQSLIIRMLNSQKELLEEQKKEIVQKNKELEEMQAILRRTNIELENFAFAASHDLKEPLRMIGMYTNLTRKRLNGQMDTTTTEFMGYVTDGVSRMQTLLNDLLEYSRMGKQQSDIKKIDLNDTLFVVTHNMSATLKDTEASIVANKLPIIEASNTEMTQLFQNIISNAIKFRKKNIKPEIKIISKEENGKYLISFQDNGIGIKKEYHERVFGIFERLHRHQDYEGSGIGLATCQKIVESIGGRIWLESEEGIGTTFFLTLPLKISVSS